MRDSFQSETRRLAMQEIDLLEHTQEMRPLGDAEIDAVSGGLSFDSGLVSVRQQQMLAVKERLEAAYAANHPIEIPIFG